MSDPKPPQHNDEPPQEPETLQGEELDEEQLENASGGSNTNCNFICADK